MIFSGMVNHGFDVLCIQRVRKFWNIQEFLISDLEECLLKKVQNKFPEKPKLSHVFRQITVFFSFKLQKPWAENPKISFSHCSLYCGNCCPKIAIRWIIQKLRFSLTREGSCFYHARIFNINSLSQKSLVSNKVSVEKKLLPLLFKK